jgi:hypothetical protein
VQRDHGGEKGAAFGRTLDPELAVDGGEPVRHPDKTAPVRAGASHAVVAHKERQRAVLDLRGHLGASGASVLYDVGQRLGDDE